MKALRKAGRAHSAARVLSGVLLGSTLGTACANYKADTDATYAIWSVHVTTSPAEIASCRFLQHVDSRDASLGCGLTVQPTPEECLRYQVRRAGGDTLLMHGPAGEAYECSPKPPATEVATAPTPGETAARAPSLAPAAAPTPMKESSVAPPPPSDRTPAPSIRVTADREAARGCVYLGELSPSAACEVAGGAASGDCAAEALRLGGDLLVRDAGRGQVFSCKARP